MKSEMNSEQMITWVGEQRMLIDAVVDQLEEVQVAFNAQFDAFLSEHNATLDRLADLVFDRLDSVSGELRSAIDEQLGEERDRIEQRRNKIRDDYLPRREQAADSLLEIAQKELAQLRSLNPQLDEREEKLKAQKASLEARLEELNSTIHRESRGLGVVLRYISINRTDRERQRVIGRLEGINESLRDVRNIWQEESRKTEEVQDAYQQQWQLESMAVARLKAELDQLEDPVQSAELALRRAVQHTLDRLDHVPAEQNPQLQNDLIRMVDLNARTDEYHVGLASVGGLIGLLRGIGSGMEAISKSLEGVRNEERMHSAYLRSLAYSLPPQVDRFHSQWSALAVQFASEEFIGNHPGEFSLQVKPLIEGPLSRTRIKDMFDALGAMITKATASW